MDFGKLVESINMGLLAGIVIYIAFPLAMLATFLLLELTMSTPSSTQVVPLLESLYYGEDYMMNLFVSSIVFVFATIESYFSI